MRHEIHVESIRQPPGKSLVETMSLLGVKSCGKEANARKYPRGVAVHRRGVM